MNEHQSEVEDGLSAMRTGSRMNEVERGGW